MFEVLRSQSTHGPYRIAMTTETYQGQLNGTPSKRSVQEIAQLRNLGYEYGSTAHIPTKTGASGETKSPNA